VVVGRLVANALAAAALAGGVGIAAAQNAAAQPDPQCGVLVVVTSQAQEHAGFLQKKLGADDFRTKQAWDVYTQAYERADAAGCY
jgi:hypothetical protein